jgi:hypothetical protein
MVMHSSAGVCEETPHASNSTDNDLNQIKISRSLKRRAQAVINDRSIDAQSRALIRYGLETEDPWLAELVRRADAGEAIVDAIDFSATPPSGEDEASEEKIEALAKMICRGDESGTKWAALVVLMATLENAAHPQALANTAKHLAFTRCGELNAYGLVDMQIAMLEGELFANQSVRT